MTHQHFTQAVHGHRAIVIGGSIAGLCAARAVSDFFEEVIIIERDPLNNGGITRKSVPQAQHTHYLLSGGANALASLYGKALPDLSTLGGIPISSGNQTLFYNGQQTSYLPNCVIPEPREFDFNGYSQSRSLVETALRNATENQSNISLLRGITVTGLLWQHGYVKGICYKGHSQEESLAADLIIDCSGRGSHILSWLSQAGFHKPPETMIDVDLVYCSARYEANQDTSPINIHVARDATLTNSRVGMVSLIEEKQWFVTLIGQFGNYPPKNEDGFLAFARTLPSMKVYELISRSQRTSDIHRFHFPRSTRRHYEALSQFPERLIMLGDTLNVINPIYGQGMTTAILQAQKLKETLTRRQQSGQGLTGLAPDLFRTYAKLMDAPWQLAAVQDMLNTKTRMERSETLLTFAQHMMAINALAVERADIHKTLLEVFHMRKPLSALYTDTIMEHIKTIPHPHPAPA
ncbi:MAG: hypothetical protein B0D91_04860 [Oceanospirillales bacterium LUC14_002_19_P2]|nr:MAG: hypothetical protein B0D91_04860 [Oceanospirillales bacterium LUC14_002_19_P2]